MLEIEGKNKMAKDRAKEGRKRAKKLREASLEKSKGKIGRFFKGVKKAIKKDTAKQKAASEARLTPKQRAHKAKASEQRAKKKEGKTWTKAVKAQKKAGGSSMNELIKARNAAKASGNKSAYAAAQNQINKAYGSKKVHKVSDKDKAESSANLKSKNEAAMKKNEADKEAKKIASKKRDSGAYVQKLAEGGKVESNPYGWPSRDARNGGKG